MDDGHTSAEETTPAFDFNAPRNFFCKNVSCNNQQVSVGVPEGWYVLRKSMGNRQSKTAAITCSLKCALIDIVNATWNRVADRY